MGKRVINLTFASMHACGTDGCKNCLIYVATLELRDSQNNTESEKVWVCSEACYRRFKKDSGTDEKEVLIDFKKL